MSTEWIYDDWGYGNNSLKNSEINEINVLLENKRNVFKTNEDLAVFTTEIHNIMISSLAVLQKFIKDEIVSEVFLYISVVDSENAKQIENESAKELNSKDSYAKFIKRLIISSEK
ncbi:DUF4303 domain-containing protein [Pseudocitrobacter sp. 73]|nr:DUF4303 domain-containing protein [Pseudocitrobacter sp. 73]